MSKQEYQRTYKLNLNISNTPILMEPFPVFQGIKLDPKLSYQAHLKHITTKIIKRTNLIRRIKALKLKKQTELCVTIFNSQIRSLLDYVFIPIISPIQTISSKLQTLQNRALRAIQQLLEAYTNFISAQTNSPKFKTIFDKIPDLF